jgi:hypothetical protein
MSAYFAKNLEICSHLNLRNIELCLLRIRRPLSQHLKLERVLTFCTWLIQQCSHNKLLWCNKNCYQYYLQCLTAEEWYLLEATRAVNQGIGRVIRHKNDYGAILLCDQRFEGHSFKAALSSWVQPHMKKQNSFGSMIRELRQFFVNAEKTVSSECISWKKIRPCVGMWYSTLIFFVFTKCDCF